MWDDIMAEAAAADRKYGPFHSTHEGYGVLAEEVAELLDAIRSNNRVAIRAEAIQVSAVAARIVDCLRNSTARIRSGVE